MLICFFDSQGIVLKKFVFQDQRVIQTFTEKSLEKLRQKVMRVWLNLEKNRVLHHDNLPCHTTISIKNFLSSKNITMAPQPSYSLWFDKTKNWGKLIVVFSTNII